MLNKNEGVVELYGYQALQFTGLKMESPLNCLDLQIRDSTTKANLTD